MFKRILNSLKFRINKLNRQILKNENSDLRYITNDLKLNVTTIYDIGANVGDTVSIFHRMFPNSTIHAFEPNPDIFDKLKINSSSLSNVILNNVGIGDKSGSLTLNRHKNSGATSFKDPNTITNPTYNNKIIDKIEVPVLTLDHYIQSSNTIDIDILKIDVEGFEMEVLKGISEDKLQNNVKVIMIEANLIEKMLGQGLIEDIIYFLRKNKFTLYNIYTQQESHNRQLYIVNLLFTNNSLLGI